MPPESLCVCTLLPVSPAPPSNGGEWSPSVAHLLPIFLLLYFSPLQAICHTAARMILQKPNSRTSPLVQWLRLGVLLLQGMCVQSLVRKLRSHMPRGAAEKEKKKVQLKSCALGLPWWLSGEESACQCKRHKFDP